MIVVGSRMLLVLGQATRIHVTVESERFGRYTCAADDGGRWFGVHASELRPLDDQPATARIIKRGPPGGRTPTGGCL